jgi:hypothetical protein
MEIWSQIVMRLQCQAELGEDLFINFGLVLRTFLGRELKTFRILSRELT